MRGLTARTRAGFHFSILQFDYPNVSLVIGSREKKKTRN